MDASFLGTDGSGGTGQATEHYIVQVLAGDIDSVRARLASSLARFGYTILEDEPTLHARRPARGWGVWYVSMDVLDYPTALTIRLKAEGPLKTRAAFVYVVKHPYLARGDKDILAREAGALAALATQRAGGAICIACGTEATEDSRFCRRCGAPMAAGAPELEVLRMSADVRAGQTAIHGALGLLTFCCLAALVAVAYAAGQWGDVSKPLRLLAIFGTFGLWLSWIFTVFGAVRMRSALASKRPARQEIALEPYPAARPAALAPPAEAVSVTEGTTELFDQVPQDRPIVYRKGGNTV
jgi:hypothetical protein